jgi:hypothetical protein
MYDTKQRLAALRDEIDQLRAALPAVTDEAEWHRMWARLNRCFLESIRLVKQYARHCEAAQARQAAARHTPAAARR